MRLSMDKTIDQTYPKRLPLGDNREAIIRPLGFEDEELLLAHYRSLPPETRLRLRQDNTNRAILKRFLEEIPLGRMVLLGATTVDESQIVAEGTLRIMHHGWARHVGEIRYCLDPDWAPSGLGGALVRELVEIASAHSLDKLVYQVLDDQVRLRDMLKNMGFVEEAVLRDHATDLAGKKHDVFIMSNYMAELWRKMEDMILDHEFPPYA
jgi:RimJ/RimL family protein N-acetyltransferase